MWTHGASTRFHSVLYLALVSGDNAAQLIPLTRLALCEGVKLRARANARGLCAQHKHAATETRTNERDREREIERGALTHYTSMEKLQINSGKRPRRIARVARGECAPGAFLPDKLSR